MGRLCVSASDYFAKVRSGFNVELWMNIFSFLDLLLAIS